MVKSCLSSSPVIHMSQSNTMPVVGLSDRPRTSRKSCIPLRETILEVSNGLLVVMTLHAYLSQGVKGFTCQVHLASLGPDHPGHLQHLPSMLQVTNVIVTAIILRTLIITVHVTLMILSHHGMSPEVAYHCLRYILLNVGKGIRTLNLWMSGVRCIDINALHGVAQHL